MKRTSVILAGLAIALASTPAFAQRDSRHEHNVVTPLGSDTASTDLVERALKTNAPTSPKDNGLPRFAIVGRDHKFYVGLGAQFLGEAVYDFGDNVSSSTLFTPSAMTPSTPGNGSNLGFGWQTSSIYLNFVALPNTKDQLGIFFKANFMGNNNTFNVYHFYARYRGLTAGYTTSLFTDGAAEPMTIDFEGPNGYPYVTVFTASWTQQFSDHLSGAIGIDAPTASLTTGRGTAIVNQRIPAVPLYIQYSYADGSAHARLSGIVRPLQYRNTIKSENSTLVGLGVQLSGMTPVAGGLSLQYNVAYGRGIANYIQDDNGLGVDAVGSTDAGNLEMVKTLGVTGGLNYAITDRLTANAVYSHAANFVGDNTAIDGSQYRYGDYVAANLIYNVNKFVSAGIEYDYGHRKSFTGTSLHASRIQCQLAVTF